ncbi:MAG: lipid A biosynthesis acyltransferase [SAR86 cluster bacterium]|uniref:Lipid A biosynthesis acyltransferase n=1 Tax=SAR86 cluster bacterium TaxID=2030880 RepID=A0A2A5AZQ3_9GAMM|nr:MAG: lipid A biosynthesis acyltransferase [SAR86 cluster bacterium]
MPLRVLHGIAHLWGNLLWAIPNRARDTTIRNLQACFPQKSKAEISSLAKDSLRNTACTAMEMGKAWLLPLADTMSLVTETEGIEAFHEALSGKEGIILLAPHQGNWEIFGVHIAKGVDTTFMYQPPKLSGLDRLLKERRSRGGIALAPTNRKGVAQLLKALQRGEVVGLLPDQVPTSEGGQFASFFGEQALTMTLVSKLIQRSKAKVFCGHVQRLPGSQGFKLLITEAVPEIYSEQLEESVRGLNQTVEQCVMEAVEQYQWEYKRFRRRPDGEKFY